jgi:hypothetical protein
LLATRLNCVRKDDYANCFEEKVNRLSLDSR